ADLLTGDMSKAEFHRLQADPRYRGHGATPEKLQAATLKQFEHAFLSLMTVEHARELAHGEPVNRLKDPVDRVLKHFQGTAVELQLRQAAMLAAGRRLAVNPEERKPRTFFEGLHAGLKARLEQAGELSEQARREFERWKKGEPDHTTRDMGSRL